MEQTTSDFLLIISQRIVEKAPQRQLLFIEVQKIKSMVSSRSIQIYHCLKLRLYRDCQEKQ